MYNEENIENLQNYIQYLRIFYTEVNNRYYKSDLFYDLCKIGDDKKINTVRLYEVYTRTCDCCLEAALPPPLHYIEWFKKNKIEKRKDIIKKLLK